MITTNKKTILITGGAGFIGSHTAIIMLEAGYDVVIIDNLCNSHHEVINKIEQARNKAHCKIQPKLTFINGDITEKKCLNNIFSEFNIDTVIHFAALKAVGESSQQPLRYYNNNVAGTLALLEAMAQAQVHKLIFSSSATVYGDPQFVPINESHPIGKATNPYGQSKIIIEDILADLQRADNSWSIARLRYFNPAGAHQSGLLGENPLGAPNNLMPYLSAVALGNQPHLNIYGNDYKTEDGTGVRDYIHVMDLAHGHLVASQHLDQNDNALYTWNLGTGKGYSVFEMISTFEKASGLTIPYQIKPRRAGDIAQCFANCDKAQRDLNWSAKRSLNDIMTDTWRHLSKNK